MAFSVRFVKFTHVPGQISWSFTTNAVDKLRAVTKPTCNEVAIRKLPDYLHIIHVVSAKVLVPFLIAGWVKLYYPKVIITP